MSGLRCHFCGHDLTLSLGERVGRRDSCAKCGRDLHICLNCTHYDVTAYNACRETRAERVVDKEASNFCDEFAPASHFGDGVEKTDPAAEAKRKLDEMFKS